MKQTRILTLALVVMFATASMAQALFVGTYNIRNNNNDDAKNGNGWDRRVSVICGQVNFEQPDIFGTQEVLHNQVLDLQAGLPEYSYIGQGRDDGKEAGEYECIWYRNDRLRLMDEGRFWLSETPDKPGLGWDAACVRICTWGKFQLKAPQAVGGHREAFGHGPQGMRGRGPQQRERRFMGKEFYFFNLHMDHVGIIARREAAKLVVSKIREIAGDTPVILTGDFNVDQTNEIYNIFTESGILCDSYEVTKQRFAENGTFNGYHPELKTQSRIDHIFVSPSFSVEHYAIMTNGYWTEIDEPQQEQKGKDAPQEIRFKRHQLRCASDHYPVWAKIRF